MKPEWEALENKNNKTTERMETYGGWLVRTTCVHHSGCSTQMAFVPDPKHVWGK